MKEAIIAITTALLTLPFFLILLLAKGGAEDCRDAILDNLPTGIRGNTDEMDKNVNEYCNPDTGKFMYMKRVSDMVIAFYPAYALIILFIFVIVMIGYDLFQAFSNLF